MYIIFDTETTGLPQNYNAPLTDTQNWPRVVQMAWQLHSQDGALISAQNIIVKPEGFSIPFNAVKVHGITTEKAHEKGIPLNEALQLFISDTQKAKYLVGHNISFDIQVVGCELFRQNIDFDILSFLSLDTKEHGTDYCAIPGGKGGKFKWPTLGELYTKLFDSSMVEAHDAAYDVEATTRAFFAMLQRRIIQVPETLAANQYHYQAPELSASNFAQKVETAPTPEAEQPTEVSTTEENITFVHLHVHSQFSVLQSTSEIGSIVKKAISQGSPAIAITENGNMMSAFVFNQEVEKYNKKNGTQLKAIIGCELNVCKNRLNRDTKDDGYPVVLLAKNKIGYHNLAKLSSIAFTEGFYYVPRIDKETLEEYKGDLIATTGGLWGEVPYLILNVGEERAEEAFLWWKDLFGENFYAELLRHGLEEENVVNETLLRFCKKHEVKFFAANNTYYTEKKEAQAQDALLCVKDGESLDKPKKYIGKRGREFRFGFPNDEFYIKSPQEMAQLFNDLPEAIAETVRIADQCEHYSLGRNILLPKFDIPESFVDAQDEVDGEKRGENAFLRHLTYEGAVKRYGEVTPEIAERLDFELKTIAHTGYPGYFLIVQDFCNKAREMGVSVGPGRGSAAGSAVAYCIGITNVDPIKYDLLFERFLNPERVSMPDIDIDFDDEGRGKVIEYVRNKYSKNAVAQIITYGSMAAKSAVRDSGRVMGLPLSDTDRIAKLIPDNSKLKEIVSKDNKELEKAFGRDFIDNAKALNALGQANSEEGRVVQMASLLEGSVRNTGIHACGVIITPGPIDQFVPVATAKDSDMWCTQFDNDVVEKAGLLKMDFLGLKTLTIIKNALKIIKQRHGINIDIDQIPLDDAKTFELFQRGDTVSIFQYESPGMQKHLKDLKPTVFEDLIAMNALYRPGPMEYIPSFIKRKHGLEPIQYDLPEMEEYLKDTYGITVYQEQVMLLSQKLANFTKGQADSLRKAMGKKLKEELDKMKGQFMEGAQSNGHPKDKLEKIWTDWEAFASYAFNKSHSTCYAWIAFQTGYLKANYPAEYMAAAMTGSLSDLKQVTFFIQDCKKNKLPVLGPDVNESDAFFNVNTQGDIRFGLAAVKGVGESAVESIVEERMKGPFKSPFDFIKRVDARTSNKRVIEGLVYSGAMDRFGIARSAYFTPDGKNSTFIETLIKYGNATKDTAQNGMATLFGDSEEIDIPEPNFPSHQPWDTFTQLAHEKEVAGIFLSGHPLDDYRMEIDNFCSKGGLELLENMPQVKGRELKIPGLIRSVQHKISKNGKPYGSFVLEDYTGSREFSLFGEEYIKFKSFLDDNYPVVLVGKVSARWQRQDQKGPEELEFKMSRIDLLGDVRQKQGKFLNITVDRRFINKELIAFMDSALSPGKGTAQLRMKIYDDESMLTTLSGNKFQLDISDEVIESLRSIPNIEFNLSEN
ncbi:MAG: polymerase subunit alpha [Bacteroidota bacterium]|jgi:DNA polymerase-3 subunit alpha